ncbi:MAG: TspO/MBR family protein, partial [Geminicoccaceae bacterium]
MGFLALCLAVAGIGGVVTSTSVDTWYRALAKPVFMPPGDLFGPVWTVLYAMMAIAAWLVWRRVGWRGWALPLFVAQLDHFPLGWTRGPGPLPLPTTHRWYPWGGWE